MQPRRPRVADAIRACWESYNRAHTLAPHVVKAVGHILRCRTAALGGHIHQCDRCGREVPLYNSCQTRHCPSCQTNAKEKWLDARLAEVLPVQYFHVVFTLPHRLNALIDANRTRLLGELFGTVNWVLQHFAQDPQWRLEGQLGFLAILHTWTQRLRTHFHVHCIVPGGVWREAAHQWVPCRGQWLFRQDSLADAFRNRYLRRLRALRQRGKLAYGGRAAPLADAATWERLLAALGDEHWIVFPKLRYFGWMAAANRKTILAAIRAALHAQPPSAPSPADGPRESLAERLLRKTGVDITLCPHCGQGHLHQTDRRLLPYRGQPP